jgi:phosphotransferase system HPr (HPr) family protein
VIGIVVVSHSPQLADAAVALALQMVPGVRPAIAIAAGVDGEIGTDATRVAAAIGEVASPDGVLVLVDLGSAVMSAELSLEFLDTRDFEVRVTSAPFVEGLMAGIVRAAGGASLDEVEREARGALESKRGLLERDAAPAASTADAPADIGVLTADLRLHNPSGLHIRPASMVVMALTPLDAQVTIANLRSGTEPRAATSPTALLLLAAVTGDVLRVSASGPQAREALEVVRALVADGFGEVTASAEPVEQQGGPTRGGPLGVSPGRAVGPVVRMPEPLAAPVPAPSLPQPDRPAAAARIEAACLAVATALHARANRVGGEAHEILSAAALMATDPSVIADARSLVLDRGDSPEYAMWMTVGELAEDFAAQGGRLAERVADLHDMRNRVVAELLGRPEPGVPVRSEPFILIARDLPPTPLYSIRRRVGRS